MRNTPYTRGSNNEKALPWKWIGVVGGIILLLLLVRLFGSSGTTTEEDYLLVTPGDQSSVYISMTSASKNRISSEQKLFASDKSVSVEIGSAIAKNSSVWIDIDKGTELEYKSSTESGNIIAVTKGRAWIQDITKPLSIEMKNYSISAPVGSTIMVEQNGPYSNSYILDGTIAVETSIGTIDVRAGNSISLLKSDLISPDTNLGDWIRPIEGSIVEYPLFMRNQGEDMLKAIIPQGTGSTISTTSSGSTLGSGSLNQNSSNIYIELTEPKSGIFSKTNTITVMGNILSKEVKRVTINNVDATVSPVNESFVLQNISITGEIFDIVYKAYDSNGSILQTGVTTIFADKNIAPSNTALVPETFPLSTKDFKITFPAENPYSTTERFIKVQGTVPKNTVDYIVVNDYRLQKFVAKSGSWYYFANMETGTMEEGLNLYNIKFYKADGTLLYTQPFTIIKESKNATVSGE